MEQNNKVSIIIPAYNAERFIERAIFSCLRSTYSNLEIIVVNDGSIDNTKKIVENIIDDRIILINQKNGGVCKARNVGIDVSKGDFIFFLDADDEITEDCIEYCVSNLLECKADIITCESITGRDLNKQDINEIYIEQWRGETALIKSLEDKSPTYAVWNKLYSKKFIGSTRFVEGRKIHEDSFFLFELFEKSPLMLVTNKRTYKPYKTAGSASRSGFSDKFFDILFFRNEKIKHVQKNFNHLEKYIPNLIIKSDMALLTKMLVTDNKYKNQEKELIREVKDNRNGFIHALKVNKRFFYIITHNLYYVYKCFYKIKLSIKNLIGQQTN